jgi:hypothetical protein
LIDAPLRRASKTANHGRDGLIRNTGCNQFRCKSVRENAGRAGRRFTYL